MCFQKIILIFVNYTLRHLDILYGFYFIIFIIILDVYCYNLQLNNLFILFSITIKCFIKAVHT